MHQLGFPFYTTIDGHYKTTQNVLHSFSCDFSNKTAAYFWDIVLTEV